MIFYSIFVLKQSKHMIALFNNWKSLFDKIIFKSEAKITIPVLIILIIPTIKVEHINILYHVTNYISYLNLVAKYTYLNWDDSFYIEV